MNGGTAPVITWAALLAAVTDPEDLPGPDSEEAALGGPVEDP